MRERFSMDYGWQFYKGALELQKGKNHDIIYASTKAGGAPGPAQEDWNDENWQQVNLPHDWVVGEAFDPACTPAHGFKPRGMGWYRKRFNLDEADRGKQLLLEFDGIATHAKIYVNGSLLHRNFCGYTSFVVDMTDIAVFGERTNTVAVEVNAIEHEGWWYEGAGIYRHVWLTKKTSLHAGHWGVWVQTRKAEGELWNTEVETTIENDADQNRSFTLISSVVDGKGKEISREETTSYLESKERLVIAQNVAVMSPLLWDLEAPHLYQLITEIVEGGEVRDRVETSFGYRTIRFCPDTGFYLNEQPVKIKGTCNHQDHAGVGVALPDAIHEYRVQLLKEMGSNAYRSAHHNPAQELLDACDRLGMLVMDENRNFDSSPEGLRQLESMVLRDRNHPSVIMYSVFNEEPLQGTPAGRRMVERMKETIRRLDDTRPVLAAMNGGIMENQGVADVTDITGFNYSLDLYDAFHQKHPKQPIVGSENHCAYTTRGVYETNKQSQVFASYDDEKAIWGQTIRETWEAANERDFVMGVFVWTGFDYRGEPSPYEWPSINSHWGVLDTCGFPKDAYYLHQAMWKEEPILHLLPHWNWPGKEGQPIRVMTHTNCDEVELFLNQASLGRKAIELYVQAEWQVMYAPGELRAIGFRNGEQVKMASIQTSGEIASLRAELSKPYLNGDGLDAVALNVYAVDSAGLFVPTANNYIQFKISGSASILGVGNGDPNCHEPDQAEGRSLFNGCCQVLIGSLIGEDAVQVHMEAVGIKPQTITIPVQAKTPPARIESDQSHFVGGWRMQQQIFPTKPEPQLEISATDMNSWERIDIGQGPLQNLNKKQGFVMFRASFELTEREAAANPQLYFYQITDYVEVYIDGQKRAEKTGYWNQPLTVPLEGSTGAAGKHQIVVIMELVPSLLHHGITRGVIVRSNVNQLERK